MRLAIFCLLASLFVAACSEEEMMKPPACEARDCSAMGLNCGRIDDPSSGTCITCGACQAPSTCGGGGQANICGCTAKTVCESDECGPVDNGCGATLDCGDPCVAPETCGGGDEPNACGRTVQAGEACGPGLACGSGARCCPKPMTPDSFCLNVMACPTTFADLTIKESELRRTINVQKQTFNPTTPCSMIQGCVLQAGERTLIRYTATLQNIGTEDVDLTEFERGPLYISEMCLPSASRPKLVGWNVTDQMGNIVQQGTRTIACLADNMRETPEARQQPRFICGQTSDGLSAGWSDLDPNDLECKFADVTGLAPGLYTFSAIANPDRAAIEADFSNNIATATITIP